MQRVYLEEDLQLIRKYFPGAKTVALHAPFELTTTEDPWELQIDVFSEHPESTQWYGDLLWSR